MNQIKKQVAKSLQGELEAILKSHLNHFTKSSKLINHKLLYCNKWELNPYSYLIPMLYSECAELKHDIDTYTLLQINIIIVYINFINKFDINIYCKINHSRR